VAGDADSSVPQARRSTREERVVLVQSLAVTWDVLDHLRDKGVIPARAGMRAADGCCKPDGGTCCVNNQVME
jgi:hypothetical protein